MITLILTLISIGIAVPGLYLAVLAIAALFGRPATSPRIPKSPPSFAVIIPAHNEALSIAETIKSVRECDYDPRQYRVFVIADNCSDATAEISLRHDARVSERRDALNPGKGQALDWFLKRNRGELTSFDAVVIIDADTQMDSLFLANAADALRDPAIEVLQGHYGVSNSAQSWRAALCEAAFASVHHLRPLGRNAIGSTAGLKGNGMIFRRRFLAEIGWPAYSIVEDLEFTSMLADRGVRVRYLPGAKVFGEMAVDSDSATSQRRRWESGRLALAKSKVPGLLLRFVRTRESLPLDMALDLLTPPIMLYLLVTLPATAASLVLGVTPALALAGLAGVSLHLVAALAHRKVSRHAWRALLCAPLFAAWKATLYLRFAFSAPETRWVRTKRAGESSTALDPTSIIE